MPVKDIEILVIGAGPAGSTVARLLADAGKEVCLLDKEAFPRHKTCGGGVPPRTRSRLGLDYSYLIKSTVDNIVLLGNWGGRLEIADSRIIDIIDRSDFDAFLVGEAVAAGAQFEDKTRMEAIKSEGHYWRIKTNRGNFSARIVCACDGAAGKTARILGEPYPTLGFALEGYLPRAAVACEPGRNTAFFEFSCVRNGYGWAFPRGGEYAVGVGIRRGSAIKLKDSLARLCSRRGLSKPARAGGVMPPQRVKGAPLPLFTEPRAWYAKNNLYFLGDAAGLVDPLTGEGLFMAVQSAIFAADAIATGGGEVYNTRIRREIIPDLEIASAFSRKANLVPRWLLGLILRQMRSQSYARLFVDLMKGKTTYRQMYAQTH